MASTPTLYGKGHQHRESGPRPLRSLVGGLLFLDFLNTTDLHHGTPSYDELSPGYVNIAEWSQHAGMFGAEDARSLLRQAQKDPREAAAVRKRLASLRTSLYEIVTALIRSQELPAPAMALFNRELHLALANGHYVAIDSGLEWQWILPTHLDRVAWEVCRSAATELSSDRLDRIHQCAAPSCQALFLDISKNGSRQFCSSTGCGAASRVRRFRERQKAGA